jgi:hypothetical protein
VEHEDQNTDTTLTRRVHAIGKHLRRDGAEGRDGRHEQPQAESRWMVDEGAVREVALCGVLQTFLRLQTTGLVAVLI